MSGDTKYGVPTVQQDEALEGQTPSCRPSLHGDEHRAEEMVIHPGAAKLYAKFPCVQRIPIFGRSISAFGPKCVISLCVVYFLAKGLGYNLITSSKYAMFTDRFSIGAVRYQRLSPIALMGFTIKVLPAGLADVFACGGYTKRWYCVAACLIGGAFTLAYGLLPAKPSSADLAAGFSFLGSFCVGAVDILTEGHYSRLLHCHPDTGPALVGSIWWSVLSAYVIGAAIQGPLSDASMPHVGLLIGAATIALPMIFFVLNWYGEKTNRELRLEDALAAHRQALAAHRHAHSAADTEDAPVNTPDTRGENCDGEVPQRSLAEVDKALEHRSMNTTAVGALAEDGDSDHDEDEESLDEREIDPAISPCLCGAFEFNRGVCHRNWRVLLFGFIMVAAVVSMACVTILGNKYDLLYCAIAVTVVICTSVFFACPLIVAKAAVFDYFDKLLYLYIPGALNNFYMAPESCYPEGPHFSYTFYNTISYIIGSFAGMAGVAAFTYFFSKQRYAFTFIVTTLIRVLASIFDIIMVKRWNLYIGIPDHAMYVLSDSIVYEICYYLAWMPMIVLLSRVCPRGSESMTYAIVAGFGNFGSSMSSVIGSLLMEFVWPVVSKGVNKCDFSNVPWLLFVGHILMPLLVIPLSFLLLPRERVCDNLKVNGEDEKASATTTAEAASEPDCRAPDEPIAQARVHSSK